MWWPLRTGLFGIVGGLLTLGMGPAIQNKDGTPAIILVKGSDVNVKDESDWTPFPF
jgi:hypothetical protein